MHWLLWVYLIGLAVNTVIVHGMAQNQHVNKKQDSTYMLWVVALWPLVMAMRPFVRR